MNILGLGGLPGDSSAVLLKGGALVAAIEETKIARRPQAEVLPEWAMDACLELGGLKAADIDVVALVRPFPALDLPLRLRARFPNCSVTLVEHHLAHAASAYYASPYREATILTLDRAGDLRCGARWKGAGNRVELEAESCFPDSLGDLYSRVTELLGMTARADEHKVQWLSTSGRPELKDLFLEVIGDGPRVDQSFFAGTGFSEKFRERVGAADRVTIAASLQTAVEETVLRLAGTGKNLCLAGGLAYNALLVAALERSGQFENVFAQPAAGNSGTALGAALSVHGAHLDPGDYCLGPKYSAEEIKKVLENCKLRFRLLQTTDQAIDAAVDALSEHKIIAWMHGRMEFGPRALGNRSILASPRDPYSTENLNLFIKHREGFRKFAASVPAEMAGEYFECGENARYLATVGRVRAEHRETLKAAVLGEDLVRVHAVRKEDNPLYWRLLHAAGKRTGLPVLYNTSFNLFGEPLVCSPRDAVRSFYASGIDEMFIGNFYLTK